MIVAFVFINKERNQGRDKGQLNQNGKDASDMNPPLNTEISKKIFYNENFNKAYDSYVDSIKRKSANDLKDFGIESRRDLIQILLVLELKRDQDINDNKAKIDFINEIGKILTEEGDFRKKILDFINNSGSNIRNIDVLKKNVEDFLNIKFPDQSNNFKNIDRTHDKDDEDIKKYRTKRQDGFIKLEIKSGGKSFDVYIKKILKSGLNKNFSDSKYVHLHMKKCEKCVIVKKVLDLNEIPFPIQYKDCRGGC